ncbi:MAG: hypothetical protein Q8K63_09040, partial [Acidimicrobiales bacterium]|nr:hypothetical protein [Acidimicrobiales bacterium]
NSPVEERPVAIAARPTVPSTTPSPVETTTTTTQLVAPTTSAVPKPTTTTAPKVVCRWSAKIVAGGIAGPVPFGDADQFAITVTNSVWAGRDVRVRTNYSPPAKSRPVSELPSRRQVADGNGTVTFVFPIGPESQGGAVSFLASSTVPHPTEPNATVEADVCDWHLFNVDYNGPEGIVGGITASGATPLA